MVGERGAAGEGESETHISEDLHKNILKLKINGRPIWAALGGTAWRAENNKESKNFTINYTRKVKIT